MQEKIIQAMNLIAEEKRFRKAKAGVAVNFGQSKRGVICRLHGSRTFTGYGDTPGAALNEAIRELIASARAPARGHTSHRDPSHDRRHYR